MPIRRPSRKNPSLMKAKGHIPIRTCIACGAKRPKRDLIRLICNDENRLIKDDSGSLKGRGVYICAIPSCLERLRDNKRLNRQLRTDKEIFVSRELIDIVTFDNINSRQEI